MYPHERSLVQKYKNRPFVLLGVYYDDPPRVKAVMERNHLTWDAWADGKAGTIFAQWNVRAIPTTYVLDGTGTIRFKNVRGQELESAIDKLVSEEESVTHSHQQSALSQ